MDEREFSKALEDILDELTDRDVLDVRSVSSFEDATILSSNEGLVVRLEGGDHFQLTIVQSKRAEGGPNG